MRFLCVDCAHQEIHLKNLIESLRKSNRELEQFASIAAHDLQEPLRSVGYLLEMLQKKQDEMSEMDQVCLGQALSGIDRMRNLVRDILLYSRVAGQAEHLESINLTEICEEAEKDLAQLIAETGTVIHKNSLPYVIGDRYQFCQLFQNLISNAIKFRREQRPEIDISAKHSESDWEISIKDNGVGLDMKYSDQIFAMFKRVHKKQSGSGIGLAICKKIVERHGGNIWVNSETGKGSTFYFTLPTNIKAQRPNQRPAKLTA